MSDPSPPTPAIELHPSIKRTKLHIKPNREVAVVCLECGQKATLQIYLPIGVEPSILPNYRCRDCTEGKRRPDPVKETSTDLKKRHMKARAKLLEYEGFSFDAWQQSLVANRYRCQGCDARLTDVTACCDYQAFYLPMCRRCIGRKYN